MEEPGLLALPEEVLVHIGTFLELRDLLACSATCSHLRGVLNDNCVWRRHYRRDIVSYLNTADSVVTPAFEPLEDLLCHERVNLLRQNHLLNNWKQGRYVDHEAQTPGNGLFLENNDRQIIYNNVFLFLHVLNTSEINIWNIARDPFFYTSVQFTLYEYNMEDEDWTDIVRVWYQIVKDKLVVIQGNLVQVFRINLPSKDLPLEYLISVDRDEVVEDFCETLYTDCYSWIVGHLLFSRLCYLPVVHIWDILSGSKLKALRAPTTGWDLYVISLDDEENVIFTLRTDDPFAPGPENYAKISNHISSYNVSKDEYTTVFTDLSGCKPVHAMRYRNFIVLFCIDDMFIFSCSVYVFDCNTNATIAHGAFYDLVGLYKSRIVEERLILSTQTSVEILDIQNLQVIQSIKINDIIDIDYLPVLSSTFLITSSGKSEIELWDVCNDQVLLKVPLQSYVFLNESCSKLVLLSGNNLTVRNFW